MRRARLALRLFLLALPALAPLGALGASAQLAIPYGVSGATSAQDGQCAKAGVDALTTQ